MVFPRNVTLALAVVLVAGAAGVVATNALTSERTVTVKPMIDLGDGQHLSVKEFDDRLDYALQLDEFNSPSLAELRERDPEGFARVSSGEDSDALYEWAVEVRQAIWIEKKGSPFELRGR